MDRDIPEITRLEKERNRKPKVILVYGHHATNEAIAKNIVPRLRSSRVALRTDMSFYEQPEGLCYVDAYQVAKKQAGPQSQEFSEIYERETLERLKEGYLQSFKLARDNPEVTVIDIHETPAGASTWGDEGFSIGLHCSDDELKEIRSRLRSQLPGENALGAWLDLYVTNERGVIRGFDEPEPENYVSIELLTDPRLYDNIAKAEVARLGYWAMEMEVRRLKPDDTREKLTYLNHEKNKYTRILELIIPVIAEFMDEKRKMVLRLKGDN